MSEAVILQSGVKQLAREGDFRAIAYWLNLHLVPQQIYARVAADRPGYLLVLVEFMQMPQSDRLNRYVCHRLYQLRSPIIRGVRVIARFLGSEDIEWDQTIRLSTTRSKRRAVPRSKAFQASSARPILAAQVASRQPQLTPTKIQLPRLPQQWASSLLASNGSSLNRSQVAMLGGSAAAAFLLGCGFEVLNYYPPQNPAQLASTPRTDRVQTAMGKVQVIAAQTDTTTAAAHNAPSTHSEITLSFSNTPGLLEVGTPADPAMLEAGAAGNSVDDAATASTANMSAAQHPPDLALTAVRPDFSALTITASAKGQTKAPQLPNLSAASAQIDDKDSRTEVAKALETLDQAGLVPVGAGRNAGEARRPEIVDVRGKRIAYLGYSDSTTDSAGFWQAGTNPAMSDRIAEDIQAIRSQVDWVVVSYHWNQALASYPSIAQMNLARHAIDAGADLVVGYHPHVLQGAEIYKGRAIAYSLGDFVFSNQSEASNTDHDTAILKVALKGDQMRLEFLPVQVVESQPKLASGEKAQQILNYLEKASALFKQPLRSPIVLDRQVADQAPAESVDGQSKDNFIDNDASKPAVQPSDSFITQPKDPAIAPTETRPFVEQPVTQPAAQPPVQAEESFTTPSNDFIAPATPAEASPAAQPTTEATQEGMKEIQPIDAPSFNSQEPSSEVPALDSTPSETTLPQDISEDASSTTPALEPSIPEESP